MKLDKNLVGIDLGGTKLASGKVIGKKLENISRSSLPPEVDKDTLIGLIKEEINKQKDIKTTGIGIGVPSIVDTKKGIVYDVVNIPSWNEVPLKDILEWEFNIPVNINNDANCHVLGEKYYGSAQGFDNAAVVSIGTGLGVGVICNSVLIEGRNCGAGEVGMVPYQDHNYEYYCSGQYFINEFKMKGEEVSRLAENGNHQALMIFEYFGNHLGNALLAVVYAYDPEIIVLGGSISKSKKYYEKFVQEKLDSIAFGNTKKNLKVVYSKLDNAAIYGAAALCHLDDHVNA